MNDGKFVWTVCESPIGPLTVVAGPRGIAGIHFSGTAPRLPDVAREALADVAAQLGAYFAGERRTFELDLGPHGSPLQMAVWRQLLEIPYGATKSYGEVARGIDESLYEPGLEPYRRARVVGAAIGRNPIPVIIPCHRVIGADGSLTGYSGGLERKRALLELEGDRLAGADRARAPKRPEGQLAII